MSLWSALRASRGTPAWDGLIRLSGGIGLVGIPLVLLLPGAGGLVAFALASVWVHGPASPFLPATYEPILILFGRVYPAVLLALIGTAANLVAEYLNYQLFKELLARRALDRWINDPRLLKVVALFNRRPFLTTWCISWSPVPDWTIRILGPLSRYPVRPWLFAMGLGRFPRFWLLAGLGRWIQIDGRLLGWLAAIPASVMVLGLIRAVYRRRRRPAFVFKVGAAPLLLGTLRRKAPIMLSLLVVLSLAADTSTAFRIPVSVTESLAVTTSGAGAAVVVIPGLAGSAFAFRRLTPLLVSTGHSVVIVEPLGMGTSGRPERANYTLEAQAARVASVLDTMGIRQALVVGHALGASIALRLALARPDLVRGVVLIEGGAAEQAATTGFRRAMVFAPWAKLMGGQTMIRKQLRKSLSKSSADAGWITDEVLDGYSRGVTRDLDQTLRAYLRMVDARDRNGLVLRLGLIHLPVLLVLGGAPHEGGPDSREVEAMSRGLRWFSLRQVPGAGHHIQEERPTELAGLIGSFGAPLP